MASGFLLFLIFAAAIIGTFLMISKLRIHPFLSLFVTALFMGLASGLPFLKVSDIIATGFGNTCRSIGIVILFGTIIGAILEGSGAATTMADTILRHWGDRHPALVMSLIGWAVSIPVFCDSGFVILAALRRSLAKLSGVRTAAVTIALATGLYATHTLVPPTPGPISAAMTLGADLRLVALWGLVVSIPAMLAGYLYAITAGNRLTPRQPLPENWDAVLSRYRRLPSPLQAFAPILIPLLLIALGSAVNSPPGLAVVDRGSALYRAITFLGTPMIALFIGVIFCIPLAAFRPHAEEDWSHWLSKGIRDGASIIMITAAGGSLGAIIAETRIGNYIGAELARFELGIFLPFIIAAALKTAQGSSTVALITASAIVAPLLPSLALGSPLGAVLATLSIGCGSMVVSHVNDSYFWVVTQFSEMDIHTAYKAQTLATLIEGITGMAAVWGLSLILL